MNEAKDLKRIQEFVTRLKSTNSTNDKIDIIKEYNDDYTIKQVLKYTYSPFKQFHLTSTTVKKNKKLEPREGYNDLFYLLDALTKRTITGHEAIQSVKGYIQHMEEWQQDLVFCILDKNLKTRTGADLINKAIPGCVPTFKVALANSYDKQKGKVNFDTQTWFASHKLDGVRCLAMVDENGQCNFYSRQGKTFDTLDTLRKEIENCSNYFRDEIFNLKKLKIIIALGKIAFDNCVKFYKENYLIKKKMIFKHGKKYIMPDGKVLMASYHPSPRNVNTKIINLTMMKNLLKKAKKIN